VVITALTNAVSIATMLLTTEVLVADVPEREEAAPAPGGHAHGGGMGMDDDMDF